eukprot:TRINITY_DN19301_c0_g1_i2.p1 TRINITY_DN19301_c0_g1~~TRINITY_DN19301_c0_g1_i2.p1  ORF type:complete len:119 (+),score=7.88 TRINITY_DN19301_c0_g1_i2:87-443(+)
MLPTVNQGANCSIEDAAVLARVLAKHCGQQVVEGAGAGGGGSGVGSAVSAALAEYAAVREERVKRLMGLSRRTGLWQTSYNPVVQRLQQAALRWTPQAAVERSMDWIYKYRGPEGLNW